MRFEVDGARYALAFRYETVETGKMKWRTVLSHPHQNRRVQYREPITRRLVHAVLYREDQVREGRAQGAQRVELARGTVRVNPDLRDENDRKLGFVKETLRREALDALEAAYFMVLDCSCSGCQPLKIMRAARKAYDERKRGPRTAVGDALRAIRERSVAASEAGSKASTGAMSYVGGPVTWDPERGCWITMPDVEKERAVAAARIAELEKRIADSDARIAELREKLQIAQSKLGDEVRTVSTRGGFIE